MHRRFIPLIVFASVLALAGCGSRPSDNANGAASNTAATGVDLTTITDPQTALAEGNRLLDENQTEAAIAAFRHAVSLDADLADAHFQLGIAYSLLEMQNEQAGIPTSGPKNGKSESERSFERAAATYRKRIDTNPEDHAAYFNLGRTYVKLLKDEEAEKAFRQAVKIKPDDTEYQTELGSILIVLAKYGEAIGPLKKALELDPSNSRAEEMLEDATAGRQRISYVGKNTNQAANNSNKANANVDASANSASNSNSAPPPANAKPRETPARTPRPAAANKPG